MNHISVLTIYSGKLVTVDDVQQNLVGGPGRHYLFTMLPCIVCRKSISGFEDLLAHDAVMSHIHVNFNVPPHLGLVLHYLCTCETLVLSKTNTITSTEQRIQHQVQA